MEDQLTKKERRELKKEQQREATMQKEKEAKMKTYIGWGIGIVVLAAIIAGFIYLAPDPLPVPDDVTQVQEWDHATGPDDAPITLVEYSDFQCPACRAYQPIVKRVLEDNPESIRFVYRHFPLISIHPNATPAAQAAEAAGRQGKFFEYHDLLFDRQQEWAEESNPYNFFKGYALALNLDIAQWEADYTSSEVAGEIDRYRTIARQLGLTGTPSFYLNGNKITNPKTLQEFQDLIDANK